MDEDYASRIVEGFGIMMCGIALILIPGAFIAGMAFGMHDASILVLTLPFDLMGGFLLYLCFRK